MLHVVRQFHPSVGGLEEMVLALARQQQRSGIDVEVLTLDRLAQHPRHRLPSRDQIDGIALRRIGYAGSRRYPLAPKVLAHVREFDLVHVHGVDFFCDFLAATAPLHRKPLVLSTHGGFFHTSFAAHFKRLFFTTVTRASFTQYRRVFACSISDHELFRRIVPPHRLQLIENGVDTTKFAGAGSATFAPVLVYVGRLASHKGLERLLDAFDVMCETVPNARLLIVGNDWDGTLDRLREKGAKAVHSDRIRFAPGLSDEDVRSVLGHCSFFVSASQYEGFGIALVEALSAGLIPIVSRLPSFEGIVSDAGLGLCMDFSHPRHAGEAMAAFVTRCRNDYEALRARAMRASQRYAWDKVEQRFRPEYEAVLGLGRRRILGVNLATLRRDEAVAVLDNAVSQQSCPQRVAFANAHTLNLTARDRDLREALSQSLVLNDGVGVDIASRIKFGSQFPDNLNGTDFVPHYLDATQHPLRIYLLGALPDVVAEAAARFSRRWPRHLIVGARDGYSSNGKMTFETCRQIRQSGADLVLVALGNPRQELWIAQHAEATGAKLLIGVGALFDFTAGRVTRAPVWIRQLRCEWMYRLAVEPRRLAGRYLIGNLVFLSHVLRDRKRV